MERESFEDPRIAAVLNESFVPIKVDREERPDLDALYMTAVQLLTRHGGWPLSVFLTPDLKPFFGGTYWPPYARGGMPGFYEILCRIRDVWATQPQAARRTADELTEAVRAAVEGSLPPVTVDRDLLRNAAIRLLQQVDWQEGGLGGAPKFPRPLELQFLMRAAERFELSEARDALLLTLRKMARGGIYDHVGGGFHRYATDRRWIVPHFEKMLYDNALLVQVYTEAFQWTGETEFADVVRETIEYVLREMTLPEGGFCSSQDADSEGVEGKYYVWTADDFRTALGGFEHAELLVRFYGVTERGNWEGKNILCRSGSFEEFAAQAAVPVETVRRAVSEGRRRLLAARERRVPPGRDDKVLVSWNGLMISALLRAAVVFRRDDWAAAAARSACFLSNHARDPQGRLVHCWKDGPADVPAFAEDHAALANALTDAYEATFSSAWLHDAVEHARTLQRAFEDTRHGGLFRTARDAAMPLARAKDVEDGATPSATGLAALLWQRLHALTGEPAFRDSAERSLHAVSGMIERAPAAVGQSLIAADFWLGPTPEIAVLAGEAASRETVAAFGEVIFTPFRPRKVVAGNRTAARIALPETDAEGHRCSRDATAEDERRVHGAAESSPVSIALLSGRHPARPDGVTVWVCVRGTCLEPATTPEALAERLRQAEGLSQ